MDVTAASFCFLVLHPHLHQVTISGCNTASVAYTDVKVSGCSSPRVLRRMRNASYTSRQSNELAPPFVVVLPEKKTKKATKTMLVIHDESDIVFLYPDPSAGQSAP
jgi:hypothetical protein